MKHLLRALLLAVAVTLCTAIFALPSAAEDFSGGFDPERFLVYEGLQARSKNDYAGLRSRYTVDDELITELVKEGHTVQYGAMMGVGSYKTTDYRHLSDLVVTYDKTTNKISFNVKNAAIAVVYDSTGKNNPSGLYTSRGEIKSSFAYTTTYKQNEMNATLLKDIAMVYRAFIIIDGNVEYVDAVGSTFGQETATYGRTTSLYEVCTYFAEEYKTASGKPFENSVAIRNVISSCMSDSFTAEFADGLTLAGTMNDTNKVVFENAKAGIYSVRYKYIPNASQGAFYAVYSAESGHTASAKIPFDASETVKEPSWCPVTSYIYLAEGKNTLSFAGSGSQPALYGVELDLVEATPVEDTSAITPKGSNTTVTKVSSNNDAGIKSYYGGNLVFLRGNDYATHSLTVNATGLYDIYFAYNCGGANVEVTANGVTAKSFVTQPFVLNWNGTNSSMGNSSLSSSAAYLKVEDVPLNKGENTVTVKMAAGFITYGVMIAVRKTETVTLYDQDGVTPISVQKVYDLADVVYPSNVKVPAGYDAVSGWSDLTLVDGKYQSTVAYGKYYTVNFYDDDKTTLLATMRIATGSDNVGPDMSGDKTFKGWSTPLSEVNSDCSVYAVRKATELTATNLVGTGTQTVEAGEGTLETIYLPVGTSNYIEFNVYADIEGYYALNLLLNDGGAKINYVRTKNVTKDLSAQEKAYYGVCRLNSSSTKASVTVDNCAVAAGTAYKNDILHIYLGEGDNTVRLHIEGSNSIGVAGITLTLMSGDKLMDGDYYAAYDKIEKSAGTGFIAAESDLSDYSTYSSANDGYSGGFLLRTNRYVTIADTLTIREDGYYALHGVFASNGATVTFTDVDDPENVVVFTVNSLGDKGGTASSPFWQGDRDKKNLFAGTYKVKITSKGNHCFTAYYLTREDVTSHTVKFYDGDGNLVSIQAVADGAAAVAPTVEEKKFLGWSADFSAVTEDMSVYAIYDVRFDVEYYDEIGKLIATESVRKGEAADAVDYTAYKEFKGWSLSPDEYIPADLSSVSANTKVYLCLKSTQASVSASDAILASASFTKVVADAVYSDFEGYYSITETETAFVAGEVYTKDGDTYNLALTDTGATYYALTVTAVKATSASTLTDYYTYDYTLADESPVKIVAAKNQNDFYTPATAGTAAAVFFPNVSGILPSNTYISIFVTADYTGYYSLGAASSKFYSHYASIRNVTTEAQNPNIEAFMTNRTTGNRVNNNQANTYKITGNKANALFASPTKDHNLGYLYLAEGLNEIRIYHNQHSNNGTGNAVSDFKLTLLREHDVENSYEFERYTTKAGWQYSDSGIDSGYGSGSGFLRVQPSLSKNHNMPYDILGGATLSDVSTSGVKSADKIPEGKTPTTRKITLKAGTYRLVEYLTSENHKIVYTFTKADDIAVSVTETTVSTAGGLMGHSYAAFKEVEGPTVVIPEDGDYLCSIVAMSTGNYISYAMFHLVPVTEETHTVTFKDTNGTPISVQTVADGKAATAPDMSGDAGFIRWDSDFSNITGDTTVTAVRRHTVTFRTHDGVLIAKKETVTGGTVIAPEAPERENYYFTGWSKDFSSVNEDMSVRATYKEKERFTVTFVDRFDTVLKEESVYTGDAVTPPTYTVPDGYLFLGWSEDTSAVFSNMTVVARTAQKTLTATDLVGTGTTTVEAGEGTLETIYLPVSAKNTSSPVKCITFKVKADIEGYYALNLLLNDGGAKIEYVRTMNVTEDLSAQEKAYYGVCRLNSSSTKASVTVDNCAVAAGTAYKNDILHIYLGEGDNTVRLHIEGSNSIGVAGITLTLMSGDKLMDGDYYAAYDMIEKSAGTGYVAAESDLSNYGDLSSGNDIYSGGFLLRTNRYVTLAETVTIREDGYYALHGVLASGNATVTFTDVNDPENAVVFTVNSLGDKGGTSSSAFWQGNRDKKNLFAGTYKVKVTSTTGAHVFTAYYLTREGDLDGVYNVDAEDASLGAGVTLLDNAKSLLLPGTNAGYIEYSVLADRSGMFRVSLAASTAGAKLNGLYVSVNGGRIYTLSPAVFGMVGDGYLSTAFDDEQCFYLPLHEGENKVRFYTGNGEKASITGARFYYEGALTDSEVYTGDSIVLSGTSGAATAVGSGTVTKNADHLYAASTSNTNGAEIVYTFTVSSPRVVYFNMEAEAKLGTVILYTLKDASGNTLRDTFYSVNHDTVGVEVLNLDRFEFASAGEYTLTVKVRRSPTNNKPGAGNESAIIGSKVELKIYSVIFARTAESFATPDDKTGDITTSNVTGATLIGDGATVTFRNVSLHENATYALRILGRVSGGTIVKITYTGAGNILESDYFYDMLFTVTEVSEIPAGNTTVYEYNTRTGRYDLATAYNADTVYYLKTGEVTASSGTVTFTATENITATQWISLGNLNLLADTYTITVTVEDGSFVVDDMVLVRTADYLRTIELDRSTISTTDKNEVRTAILSDNHYVHGELGGYGDLERQNLMIDMLLSEYNTAESLDAAFLAGDLGNFRLNATNTIDNGQIYYYSATYLVENVLRRLNENGLPYFATHSGHDYMSSETWYDLFGYEKNYVVVIEDAAFICLDFYYDQADYFAHEPDAAQVDISDEVYESILAVLNRDDITYASMVIHYNTSRLPNVTKLKNHPKLNVVFGGHTHDNTTQMSVGSNVQSSSGALFLQHSHFSIVSGYDTGGKTIIDPIINLTNEGYYQVFSNVSVGAEVYATTAAIGIEYANSHETTKLASGNYSTSGRWQTAAYTVDGKKIIFFRDEIRVEKKQYKALPYKYYVIDRDNVYPVDLTNAVSETYQFTYTGAEDTGKSVKGLVYGVDYYKVGMANGSDVVVFPDSFNTTAGNYNLTTTGKTYYLVNGDGSLALLSGVTVAPHAVAEANRVIEEYNTYNKNTIQGYEVSGNPWGLRILERVNGTETDIVESYFVYGGYTFNNTYIGYMRVRPRDMAGYIDHLYVVVDTIEKN